MQQLEHGSHGSTTLALMISHLVSGISQQKRLLYCLDYLKTLRRREVFVRSSKDGFLYDHPRFLRVKNGSPTFPDSVSTGSTKKNTSWHSSRFLHWALPSYFWRKSRPKQFCKLLLQSLTVQNCLAVLKGWFPPKKLAVLDLDRVRVYSRDSSPFSLPSLIISDKMTDTSQRWSRATCFIIQSRGPSVCVHILEESG